MKTRFFKVAQSGETVDGREITPAQIDQMAASYNPATYGARVNLEHYLSFLPDGVFKAYGDVLALKAEDGPDGSRVLKASIDATPDLVKLRESKQKAYWSIEMHPQFPTTGGAYLMGLAMTDTPASLGTEVLEFALSKEKLYSFKVESADDDLTEDKPAPTILDKVKTLLSAKSARDDTRGAERDQAMETIAAELGEMKSGLSEFANSTDMAQLATKLDKLAADVTALTGKLANTPATTPRPPAGGADAQQTDC